MWLLVTATLDLGQTGDFLLNMNIFVPSACMRQGILSNRVYVMFYLFENG
jgi:hypothetical protein